ncbi:MAG: choice-of-anchor D domain-containing protein, partial [Terracidiphilus sp.]
TNAYQKVPTASSLGGMTSGYILEISAGATAVLGGRYLDGTGSGTYESSSFGGIALDSHSNVFVVGLTGSTDFPLVNPFATEFGTLTFVDDMILAEMSPDLSTLEFGSYLNPGDQGYSGSNYAGIAIDNADHLVVAGTTFSTDFPTTAGSFEPQLPPAASPSTTPMHTFVTKIDLSTPAPSVCLDQFNIAFGNVNANQSSLQTLHVTNCGNAALNIQSINSSDAAVVGAQSCGSVAPGSTCPVTLTFTPISSDATSGTITLVDNAVTVPQTIAFTGQGIAPKAVPQSNPFSLGHILVGTVGPV